MIFATELSDIILTGQSSTITFQITKGNNTVILKEKYSPDNSGQIRIGGLPKIANTCLYGNLGSASQATCHANFSFSHGTSPGEVYAALRRNNRTPAYVLSMAAESTMVAGCPHLLTLIDGGSYSVMNGTTALTSGSFPPEGAKTYDVSLLYDARATHIVIGGEHTVWIDHATYADALPVRFLNIYDVPQTVVFRLGATVKPAFTPNDAVAYGVTRRYGIEAKDDFSAKSGSLQCHGEYLAFYDLLQTRRAQALTPAGTWVDILPDKSSYTHKLNSADFDKVEISFHIANALDAGALLL